MAGKLIRLSVVFAFLATPSLASAQDPAAVSDSDRRAIRAVIQAQLDAFRGDDGPRAFSYASPAVREMFRTPEIFMAMVREKYSPVYRPREVEFKKVYAKKDQVGQTVRFVGPKGKGFMGIYAMERQRDGSWRIDGVVLVRIADRAI